MNQPNRRSSPVGLLRVLSGILALLTLTTSLHAQADVADLHAQADVAEPGLARAVERAIAPGARPSNAERAPSRPRAVVLRINGVCAGEAGLLGACSHFSDTLLAPAAPDSGSAPAVVSSQSSVPDRPLRFVVGTFVAAAAADVSISMYQIQRGAARERGFGAWWQNSPVPFALSKSVMATAFVYGLRELRKTKPKTALVLGIAASAVEVSLAVRSARLSAIGR